MIVVLLTVCRYVSFYLLSPLSLSFPSFSPSLPLLSSHSCLSLVWRASTFVRGRKGLVSCLYATCTAVARSAAQSDRSTSPLILYGYWYAGRPIRGPLFLFNKRLGLSLPQVKSCIGVTPDPSEVLPLANGLARQTSLSYHLSSLVFLCSAPPLFFFLLSPLSLSPSPSLILVCLTTPLPLSLLPLF